MKSNALQLVFIFLLINVHAQEKTVITSDNVKLYINVRGNGPPCLYVHGGPGAGSFFLEKLSGDFLERHFRMIYLDQRGSGRSSSPSDNNYSMERMVRDFEEVRRSLEIDQWITLGHSFGGLLQMGYVQRYPKVVKGMIMINCCLNIKDSFNSSWCPKACELLGISNSEYYLEEAIPLKQRWDSLIVQLVQRDLIWKMAFSSKDDVEEMNAACSEIPRGNTDFEMIAFSLKDYYLDFHKITPEVKVPVLFFYGKKDWMVGPDHYKNVHFPVMFLRESDCEHMMPFLQNKDDLENAVLSYIGKYKL